MIIMLEKLPALFQPGMKSNETLYLFSKLRCIFVSFDVFACWMHKMKLDNFFWYLTVFDK